MQIGKKSREAELRGPEAFCKAHGAGLAGLPKNAFSSLSYSTTIWLTGLIF